MRPTGREVTLFTLTFLSMPAGGIVFFSALIRLGADAAAGKPLALPLLIAAVLGLAAAVYGLIGFSRMLGSGNE